MKQHAKARIGTIVLLVTLIAASFPAPASAIISVLSVSPPKADVVPGRISQDQSNLLQAATPTETPTNTPAPASTNTPAPPVQSGFIRPQIAVKTYSTNPADVRYGQDFKLIVKLRNEGQASAYNVQASFTSS